jgi:hypothetical protein
MVKGSALLHTFMALMVGKQGVGDTFANKGQCVGLVEAWLDSLGAPHIWGNAKDLLYNAPTGHYKRTYNSPTNLPSVGDVVVWGNTWGSGYGHCGIVVAATAMAFTAFEQNDPLASKPHVKGYSYDGVIGWLTPKELL